MEEILPVNFVFKQQVCGRVGPGISGSITGTVQAGGGEFCEGDSGSGGFFAEGGDGIFGGLDIGGGLDDSQGGINLRLRGGAGGGGAAGGQACYYQNILCKSEIVYENKYG